MKIRAQVWTIICGDDLHSAFWRHAALFVAVGIVLLVALAGLAQDLPQTAACFKVA